VCEHFTFATPPKSVLGVHGGAKEVREELETRRTLKKQSSSNGTEPKTEMKQS
jgi:hypothetical protein